MESKDIYLQLNSLLESAGAKVQSADNFQILESPVNAILATNSTY